MGISAQSIRAQSKAGRADLDPTGVYFGLAGWASHPLLHGDARTYLHEFGDLGFGIGGTFEVGIAFSRFGVSVGVDAGRVSFNQRSPSTTTLSLLGHWMPTASPGGAWRLIVTGGVVRTLIDVGPVPNAVDPSDAPKLYGTGARLGLEAARLLNRNVELTLGAAADILSADLRSSSTFPYVLAYDIHRRGSTI
ncbi:MAG: hypothetical protein ACREOJ_00645, partial [Gemmatimonadaceae bacterium]